MTSKLLVLTYVLWAAPLAAQQEIHSKHFILGYPTGAPTSNDLIIRDVYALSHNDTRKFADWLAYRLTAAEVVGSLDLAREWRSDPWLAGDERLEATPNSADDFRGAHDAEDYDRGHLAPLASFKGSEFASQLNYYSNIVPQLGPLNQGPWQDLEQAEREIVCAGEVLWVMTGPLFDGLVAAPLPQADEAHEVPTGFWKILTKVEPDGFWIAAFIFEQTTPSGANIVNLLASVDEIELRSGLDFFRELPAALEGDLEEEAISGSLWTSGVPSNACDQARTVP